MPLYEFICLNSKLGEFGSKPSSGNLGLFGQWDSLNVWGTLYQAHCFT
jgi:hypothetical protein